MNTIHVIAENHLSVIRNPDQCSISRLQCEWWCDMAVNGRQSGQKYSMALYMCACVSLVKYPYVFLLVSTFRRQLETNTIQHTMCLKAWMKQVE